jgi:hypothetical protein
MANVGIIFGYGSLWVSILDSVVSAKVGGLEPLRLLDTGHGWSELWRKSAVLF